MRYIGGHIDQHLNFITWYSTVIYSSTMGQFSIVGMIVSFKIVMNYSKAFKLEIMGHYGYGTSDQ